jgi:hypothetical protein
MTLARMPLAQTDAGPFVKKRLAAGIIALLELASKSDWSF